MRENEILEIIFQVLLSCHQKECHPTDHLGEDIIIRLIKSVKKQFKAESPLLTLSGPFTVVGDIHGNISFLVRLFQTLHYPLSNMNSTKSTSESAAEQTQGADRKYLFLGDYVDRGKNSIEVLLLLYSLKLQFPNNIYLLRGNHETNQFKRNSSFRSECLTYLSEQIYKLFLGSFAYIPLSAVVNGVLCLHGGLSPSIFSLDDIQKINVPLVDLNGTPAADLLWSDPDTCVDYYQDSPRGFGYLFGSDPLGVFLEDNGLKALIRGHQFCESGFSWAFSSDQGIPSEDFDCLTVFSSPDYNGSGNVAAVALISENGEISIQTFQPFSKEEEEHFRILFPEWILSNIASFQKSSFEEPIDFVDYMDIPSFLSVV